MAPRVTGLLLAMLISLVGLGTVSGGISHSSPGDALTYLSDPGRSSFNGAETTITATNAASLTETWSAAGRGGYISSQPIVDNGIVYWGDYNGYEHATNVATRQDLWTRYLGSYVAGPLSECVPDQMGVLGAAAVGQVNGRTLVFVPGGGPLIGTNSGPVYFFALDPTTGQIVWQTQVGATPTDALWSSPLLYNGSIFEGIASHGACPAHNQGRVVKLDAASGTIQGTFTIAPASCPNGGAGVWGSPTVDEATGIVYFASTEMGVCSSPMPYAQSIIAIRAADLSYVSSWQQGDPANEDHDFGSTPTLFSGGGRSLVGVDNKNGMYYAFDRSNLAAGPVWTYNLARTGESPEAGDGSISPAAWDGTTLYVAGGTSPDGTCQGTLQALDPATGAVKWRDCLAGPVIPAVTAAPGLLVVGAGSHLVVVNATTGAVLWSWADPDGREFWAAPTIANGTLYAANSGYGGPTTVPGRLYAFNVTTAGAPSTVTSAPVVGSQPGCPSGWSCLDIGGPLKPGSDALINGTWTVVSNGYDIWQTADQFHFDYQIMNGDGSVSARAVSQTASDPWAKAGVMLRTSIDPAAAFYDAVVTPNNGISVQYRSPAGATAVIQASLAGAVPTYLKVTRAGTSFSAYTSTDGTTWTPIPGSTITLAGMTGALLGGLAVTVHNFTGSSTVTFNTVSVAGGTPVAPGIGQTGAPPAPAAALTNTPVAVVGSVAGGAPPPPVVYQPPVVYIPPPPPSTPTPTATMTAVPIATDTPQPSATYTPQLLATATATVIPPTPLGMTSRVVRVTGKAQRGKKIAQPVLVIHNSPRIVRGGRSTACDLRGNTNGAQERGCEVVSSIWLPYMKVMFILTFPNGARETFVDYADHRGHALHPFNVTYLPPKRAKQRHASSMAQIEVVAENSVGIWTKPTILHFTITR